MLSTLIPITPHHYLTEYEDEDIPKSFRVCGLGDNGVEILQRDRHVSRLKWWSGIFLTAMYICATILTNDNIGHKTYV